MTRFLHHAVFVAGLAVVGWVGAGYIGTNTLALAVTGLVAAFYLMGGLELHRFQQATGSLVQATNALSEPPASLGDWLASLHPSLRNAVRLRVEGERVGLPGPALAPYLAGLLVLLGMLGTFLGMVVTLNGTGAALQGATDLEAIRESLSAPVRGLGLAFGTSVAGVAASAALGLVSALCRRERLQASQALDAKIASTLRVHSQAHRRDESFKLLQRQADLMPELVGQLQAMMGAMERQTQVLSERLIGNQAEFHGKAEAVYAGLASSVDQSLKHSLIESARVAGAAIQPVVEATMAGIARETASLHGSIAQTVQQQLEGLSSRFEASTGRVADTWQGALAAHQRTSEALSSDLRGSLEGFAQSFEQRSTALVDGVSTRLETTVGKVSDTWQQALARHQETSDRLSGDAQQALSAAATAFEAHAASLLRTVGDAQGELQAALAARDEQRLAAWTESLTSMGAALQKEWQQAGAQALIHQQKLLDTQADLSSRDEERLSAWTRSLAAMAASLQQEWQQAGSHVLGHQRKLLETQADLAARDEERLAAFTGSLEAMAASLRQEWQQAGAHALNHQQKLLETQADLSSRDEQRLAAWTGSLESMAASLQREWQQAGAHALDHQQKLLETQADLASRDEQRLAAWTGSLEAMAGALRQEWQQAGAHSADQQRQLLDALTRTAGEMSSQNEAHAKRTVTEIAQLLQAAAEAPRAAAEVVSELRQKLSDSMARDNAMLEERNRLLETLGTLLDAVNHASTEQRSAVDALVAASAEAMERAGSRFAEQVETQTGKMAEVAAQVTGSAVEVASLGETFGFAVQRFGESNDKLVAHLQRVEGALGKSMARSDEQLAYYVAQAREVIDLSIMSQKQIVEDLQQIASRQPAAVASEA
jgi:polyhydroxyalkanoate synthesis regulator phasin